MRAILNSSPARFLRSRPRLLCTLLLAPMGVAVEVPVPDSLVTPERELGRNDGLATKFTLAGSNGTHFREIMVPVGFDDCTGSTIYEDIEAKTEFDEIGAAIDHEANDWFRIGVRGGYVWSTSEIVSGLDTTVAALTQERNYLHLDPYVAVEGKWVGIGIGGVFSGQELPTGGIEHELLSDERSATMSGHVRVGRLDAIYANATRWEGVPLLSGGEHVVGVGVRPVKPLELYAGYVSDGPYQTDQWMGRITVDPSPNWSFFLSMRFPQDWNGLGDERSTALGASYRAFR